MSNQRQSEVNTLLPRLVAFGGYSNSGKTTYCTPVLEELGYTVLSTSAMLHEFCDRFMQQVLNLNYDSYDRTLIVGIDSVTWKEGDPVRITSSGKASASSRKFLIDTAEKALIPVFSRSVFINSICDRLNRETRTKFAVEIFSAEEYRCFCDRLDDDSDLSVFNLRSSVERPQVDSRTLIPHCPNIYHAFDRDRLKENVTRFLESDW